MRLAFVVLCLWSATVVHGAELAARFVTHLRHGRVAPRAAGFDLPTTACDDTPQLVHQLLTADDVGASLASMEPQIPPYQLLKRALVRYRQLAREHSLAPLPALPERSLKVGDAYAGTPQLRRQLILLGDLPNAAPNPAGDPEIIDTDLTQALQRFQARHGLSADGALGRQTLVALSVPMQQRVRQIELSLER